MGRTAFVRVLALTVVSGTLGGCRDRNRAKEHEPCTTSSDCEVGLVCHAGKCETTKSVESAFAIAERKRLAAEAEKERKRREATMKGLSEDVEQLEKDAESKELRDRLDALKDAGTE